MWMRAILLALVMAQPARADVAEAVTTVIVPGYQAFAEATAHLSDLAAVGCTDQAALRSGWNAAFDAWLEVAHFRMGPSEVDGRALAIAFWPDPKGSGAKAQAALMASGSDKPLDPATFHEQSVAARGLFGLERLLYPMDRMFRGPAACPLIQATAADLASMAAALRDGWAGGYADHLLQPGSAGNTDFLTQDEARRALLTALITGLEFNADQRLARPLGEFAAPRPERAEARASGRAQQNLAGSLRALDRLARALVPEAPLTQAAFARAISQAEALDDPGLAGVSDPQRRLKIEIVQQSVRAVNDAAMTELVPALGVGLGFNAADGD